MKTALLSFATTLVYLATALPAFAATEGTRTNGMFVLIFLGFCAFVVVAQLIPAIITLVGMARGFAEKRKTAQLPK